MPTTLLKRYGGFDFSPYIAASGYEIVEDVPIVKSSKQEATGYEKRVLATYGLTTIRVKFIAGLSNATTAAILGALNVGNRAIFQYWSLQKNEARKALFMVQLDPITVIKDGTNLLNASWGITLTQDGVASDISPTTVFKYGTVVDDTDGTWINKNNILAADGAYATTAGSTSADWNIVVDHFGFAIPEGAIINKVTIEMKYKLSTAASSSVISLFAQYKGTKRGTPWSSTAKPTADTVVSTSATGAWTVAQLNSTNAQICVRVRRKSSVACTFSFDYVKMTVEYVEVG
jgi:hypothetical protein